MVGEVDRGRCESGNGRNRSLDGRRNCDGRKGRSRRRMERRILLLAVACAVVAVISLGVGRYPLSPAKVVQTLFGGGTSQERTVVLRIRLPRIMAAALIGAGLALAGQTMQMVFRNPLVSPDVLGTSTAAGFGASISLLLGLSTLAVTVNAFIFGVASVVLVWAIGSRVKGEQTMGLILIGMVVSSLFSAGTSFVKLIADPNNILPAITYFLMGSLAGCSFQDLQIIAVPMVISFATLLLVSWKLNILSLSEDEAKSLGVNTRLLRSVAIGASTLMTASAVAVSGQIGWVGLIVPHMARRITGSNATYSLPASMFFGATFLIIVDNVSRTATTAEIPIGILTAFIGAPFFLYLILKENRHEA